MDRKTAEEKEERLERGRKKGENVRHKERCKKIQTKITETLLKIPSNRQKIIREEEERERKLLLEEAKDEIWKRWRQNKGRKNKNMEFKKQKE